MILHLITQTCFWPHEAYITGGRGGNQGKCKQIHMYIIIIHTHNNTLWIYTNKYVCQEKNAMWENGKTDKECWGR